MEKLIPSKYQQAIFDFVAEGEGNAIVNAVAGSGKTTTLLEAARLIKVPGLFLAYNKHIAALLKERLKGTRMIAKTVHSIGNHCLYRRLGKLEVQEYKYHNIIQRRVREYRIEEAEAIEAVGALRELVDQSRNTLTDPNAEEKIREMCQHFGILPNQIALELLPEILDEGRQEAQKAIIDYTDMVWLPIIWDLEPPCYKWVFVDEAQDLSATQLEIAMRCKAHNGRMLFVGDPHQSIYGFAGADIHSFANIKKRTQAKEFPLSISYRCPTLHIKQAQKYVKHIEARQDAPTGTLQQLHESQLHKYVQEGDLIISRLTAPLVRCCMYLLHNEIPARVKGIDLGKDIIKILEAVLAQTGVVTTIGKLIAQVDTYEKEQVERQIKLGGSPSQRESVRDKCEALRSCIRNLKWSTVEDLQYKIIGLFSDEKAPVWLSTVHKAKGLEEQRVFLLSPDDFPLEWENQQEWEMEQEINLKYVALTRSTDTLIYLIPETKN